MPRQLVPMSTVSTYSLMPVNFLLSQWPRTWAAVALIHIRVLLVQMQTLMTNFWHRQLLTVWQLQEGTIMERIVIAVLRHPQVLWRCPLFILAACLALVLRGTKVLLTVVRHHPLNEPACKCPFHAVGRTRPTASVSLPRAGAQGAGF